VAAIHEAPSDCRPELILFISFEALEIEVSDLLVPNLNDTPSCNSTKSSRKRPDMMKYWNR
jgi:hypothetical protein